MDEFFGKRASTMMGMALLAGIFGLFLVEGATEPVHAAQNKAASDDILKVAASIKNGNPVAAKEQATALASKFDIDEIMEVLKPRRKGGLGVGKTAGDIIPDGIELFIDALERGRIEPGTIVKHADALEEMAHRVAAVAEAVRAKPPAKLGRTQIKCWNDWSTRVREGASDLARAAKAKKVEDVKTAVVKINTACNSCHASFRGGKVGNCCHVDLH